MKLVSVIPIVRGISKEELSYFTSRKVAPGTVVTVPLRKKEISAIVSSVKEIKSKKGTLKEAPYAVRKIKAIGQRSALLPEFVASAHEAARYFASTPGAVLSSLVPKAALDSTIRSQRKKQKGKSQNVNSVYILQDKEIDRLSRYKSIVREQFAKDNSIVFILPTVEGAKRAFEYLNKSAGRHAFLIHSSLSKNQLVTAWKNSIEENHPVLVVGTAIALSIPRTDIGTIIVEDEHSRNYKKQRRPFVDVRTFAEIFAKNLKISLIFGDQVLRVETLWRHHEQELYEITKPKMRHVSSAVQKITDMTKYKPSKSKGLVIISDDLAKMIREAQRRKESLFIFSARRGLAPITVCLDCGKTVLCHRCASPVVLHATRQKNVPNKFVCHRCTNHRSAKEVCINCESWNLKPLGVGIELVESVLKKAFKESHIFRIDSDSTKTYREAQEIAQSWRKTPGSILLGTRMALQHLDIVQHTAIASLDSLFSIPDFRMNERIFNLLINLRQRTEKSFLVQTRNSEQPVLKHALEGDTSAFYNDEIEDRKNLKYPPFSTLIKISAKGKKNSTEKTMKALENTLVDYNPSIYPAFISVIKGSFVINALIQLDRKKWVDEKLLAKLRSLPPALSVDVDPTTTL